MNMIKTLLLYSLLILLSPSVIGGEHDISVQQAHRMATHGEALLIDVRAIEEWKQTGLAVNSHPISMHQKGGMSKLEQDIFALIGGDKTKVIAIICAGGVRSARVMEYLKTKGYRNILNVKEGMIGGWYNQGWIEQGLPVVEYMSTENF